jgi:hypothetical protein
MRWRSGVEYESAGVRAFFLSFPHTSKRSYPEASFSGISAWLSKGGNLPGAHSPGSLVSAVGGGVGTKQNAAHWWGRAEPPGFKRSSRRIRPAGTTESLLGIHMRFQSPDRKGLLDRREGVLSRRRLVYDEQIHVAVSGGATVGERTEQDHPPDRQRLLQLREGALDRGDNALAVTRRPRDLRRT